MKEMNWLISPITGVLLFSVAISAQAKVAITVDKDAQRMTVEVDGVRALQLAGIDRPSLP